MSWIDDYLRYTQKNEAPEAFHFWSGLTAIAAVSRRNVYVDRGFYKIYPGQLMVVLVAGSAKMRKSTALNIAGKIVEGVPDVVSITGKSSPEAFLDSLCLGNVATGNGQVGPRDSCAYLNISELSTFLSKQAYTEALIPILTHLSDAPSRWSFKTRGHGEIILTNVCITMLGASTPDWLGQAIPQNSFSGGFMSRVVFVYKDTTDRINPMPSRDDIDLRLEAELILRLRDIATRAGQVPFTHAGRAYFMKWYGEYMRSPTASEEGYWGRRPDHMLRVAAILTLADEGASPVIDETNLERADRVLREVETGMPLAFKNIGSSAISDEQDTFLRILRKLGGAASFGEIMSMAWRKMDNTTARAIVETLKAARVVEETVISGGSYIKLVGGN